MAQGHCFIPEDNLRMRRASPINIKTTQIDPEVLPELAVGYDVLTHDVRSD